MTTKHRSRTQRSRRLCGCSAIVGCSSRRGAAVGCRRAAPSQTRAHVETLASPTARGRLAGSNGERLASDYLVAELQKIGAKPLPGPEGLPAAVRVHRRHARRRLDGRRVGGPRTFDAAHGDVQRAVVLRQRRRRAAPVVFAGYGIVVPESQDFGYDSYATLDVKDKVVLVLRYFPEDAESEDARRSSRATPTCATRRWPRGSAARRRCSSSPARARRTPARRCR